MSTFSRYIFSQNEGGKGERSRAVRRISKKSSNFVTVGFPLFIVGFPLFINQLASFKATPGCTNAYFHCRPLRIIFRLFYFHNIYSHPFPLLSHLFSSWYSFLLLSTRFDFVLNFSIPVPTRRICSFRCFKII